MQGDASHEHLQVTVPAEQVAYHRISGTHRISEVTPDLRRHEGLRGARRARDVNNVITRKWAGPPEHRLGAVVVTGGSEDERPRLAVEGPAGETARCLLDVVLGVVPDPEREELHQLAREVLVRPTLHVAVGIEPYEHRRILRNRECEVLEMADAERAKDLVLPEHELGYDDLVDRRREVAVPQQRHLLPQR